MRDKELDELVMLAVRHTSMPRTVPSTAHVVLLKRFVAWAAQHEHAAKPPRRRARDDPA